MSRNLVLGYCPIGNGRSINPFDDVFASGKDISQDIQGVDAVVFWGGTDIHPSFYNQKHHRTSQAPKEPSQRDVFEWKAALYCRQHDIPMIGVCRGAQLMCALAGGILIQDCNGHNCGQHEILTKEGEFLQTTSAHHQMMYPYDVPHELLAWSSPRRAHFCFGETNVNMEKMKDKREPEVVYFPEIKALAIQGHPEWEKSNTTPFSKYVNRLVRQYLFAEVEA
jgi:gamma-glutamyl-gamma-aminobutyrate hydrolase PuuD